MIFNIIPCSWILVKVLFTGITGCCISSSLLSPGQPQRSAHSRNNAGKNIFDDWYLIKKTSRNKFKRNLLQLLPFVKNKTHRFKIFFTFLWGIFNKYQDFFTYCPKCQWFFKYSTIVSAKTIPIPLTLRDISFALIFRKTATDPNSFSNKVYRTFPKPSIPSRTDSSRRFIRSSRW